MGSKLPISFTSYQCGSRVITPILRMLKDGPVNDVIEEVTLEWAQYVVFVASFHAAWIWGCVLTVVNESSAFHLALLSVILCVGIHLLLFKQSISLDQLYSKYRQLESQISHMGRLLLWHLWQRISPITKMCNAPVSRRLTHLGGWMGLLPPALPEKDKRPYAYNEMATSREIRLLRLVPRPFSRVVRCRMEHHPLDRLPDYEAISYTWGDETKT